MIAKMSRVVFLAAMFLASCGPSSSQMTQISDEMARTAVANARATYKVNSEATYAASALEIELAQTFATICETMQDLPSKTGSAVGPVWLFEWFWYQSLSMGGMDDRSPLSPLEEGYSSSRRETKTLICAMKKLGDIIETCHYTDVHGGSYDIPRAPLDIETALIDMQSKTSVAKTIFHGGPPPECPATSKLVRAIYGTSATTSEIMEWVDQYWRP